MQQANESVRILLIDQNETDYASFKRMLSEIEEGSFDLEWARTYEDGLEKARQTRHDVFLVDFQVGEHSGLDFLHQIQKEDLTVPVIILADIPDYRIETEAMKAGAAAYIAKHDFSPSQLKRSIRNGIEHASALEALRESEARLRGIFYWSAIGIALINMDRMVIQHNPALSYILGYIEGELCGLDFVKNLVHPDDIEEFKKRFRELTDRDHEYVKMETRFLNNAGQWTWVRITISLFSETDAPPQFAIALVEDIEEQKQAEMALKSSEEKLRILSARLIDAQENERKLITQELHDSIGASLTAIKFALESRLDQMEDNFDDNEGIPLEQIISMVKETIEETQRISTSLRPSILDDMGILKTIGWICRKFNEIYSEIQIEKRLDVQEDDVPEPLKIVVCRVIQEALNNIAKHAQTVAVTVTFLKTTDGLELLIEDNGQGFDIEQVLSEEYQAGGMGLSGMKDRTELSGGAFEVLSKNEKGTTIRALWSIS